MPKIVQDNLNQLYAHLLEDLEQNLPGEKEGEKFVFDAFGEKQWIGVNFTKASLCQYL